jgi:hypothetical protein
MSTPRRALGLVLLGALLTALVHFYMLHQHIAVSGGPSERVSSKDLSLQTPPLQRINATISILMHELEQIKANKGSQHSHPPTAPPSISITSNPTTNSITAPTTISTVTKSNPVNKPRKALIFTMDSIQAYEENSKRGGAAGNSSDYA